MSQEIILYDLPSREPCRSWSGNVWKTRLALNFKAIPYQTEWVPYTQLQERLQATGLKPNPPGSWSAYSAPTIRLPDGTHIMDSARIATTLESLHPTPPLHLDAALEQEAQAAINAVFFPLVPYLFAVAVDVLVAPEDLAWFKADRAARFGVTVEELEAEKDADAAYVAARPGFEKCMHVLTVHKCDQGPFVRGSVPCYADFYLVATMAMFARVAGKCWDRFRVEAGLELCALYDACESWMRRMD